MSSLGAGVGSLSMIIGFCLIGQLYLEGYHQMIIIAGIIINLVVGVFVSSWMDKPMKKDHEKKG